MKESVADWKPWLAEPAMDEAGATAYAPAIRVLDQTSPRLALVQIDWQQKPWSRESLAL
jgi:hypothetical protein